MSLSRPGAAPALKGHWDGPRRLAGDVCGAVCGLGRCQGSGRQKEGQHGLRERRGGGRVRVHCKVAWRRRAAAGTPRPATPLRPACLPLAVR